MVIEYDTYRVITPSVDKYLMKYKYINRRKLKSNFEENIKIDQGNRINSYFLIHPPPTPTIRLNPPGTRLYEACTVSPKIPSQQVTNPCSRALTPW